MRLSVLLVCRGSAKRCGPRSLCEQHSVGHATQGPADTGREPEEPKLNQYPIAHGQRRGLCAARWVMPDEPLLREV